jgi:hypothetical protein
MSMLFYHVASGWGLKKILFQDGFTGSILAAFQLDKSGQKRSL